MTRPQSIRDAVVLSMEETMESASIVVFITLTFAVVNLLTQLLAAGALRRDAQPMPPAQRISLEHPFFTWVDGMPRI